jgi:hypothetical protein
MDPLYFIQNGDDPIQLPSPLNCGISFEITWQSYDLVLFFIFFLTFIHSLKGNYNKITMKTK